MLAAVEVERFAEKIPLGNTLYWQTCPIVEARPVGMDECMGSTFKEKFTKSPVNK
jgi:hypothetical protein